MNGADQTLGTGKIRPTAALPFVHVGSYRNV